jgi:hypothetical protein
VINVGQLLRLKQGKRMLIDDALSTKAAIEEEWCLEEHSSVKSRKEHNSP